MVARETYGFEHPYWLPRVNHDYDVVLRQWRHPPPRWFHGPYLPKRGHTTKWDTVAGIIGSCLLVVAIAVFGFVRWM